MTWKQPRYQQWVTSHHFGGESPSSVPNCRRARKMSKRTFKRFVRHDEFLLHLNLRGIQQNHSANNDHTILGRRRAFQELLVKVFYHSWNPRTTITRHHPSTGWVSGKYTSLWNQIMMLVASLGSCQPSEKKKGLKQRPKKPCIM